MFIFLFTGCVGIGRIVSTENRILLSEEQAQEGTFVYGWNSLNYSYSLDGEVMAIKGEVLARGSINSLRVRLLLLDETGAIVEGKYIYSSGYRNFHYSKLSNTFSHNIILPDEVKGFSFDFFVEYQIRR